MSKRAYITVATENYHYLALALGRSINLFSKYPLHVFCINYLPAEENKGEGETEKETVPVSPGFTSAKLYLVFLSQIIVSIEEL
jgi:hypothetical protein